MKSPLFIAFILAMQISFAQEQIPNTIPQTKKESATVKKIKEKSKETGQKVKEIGKKLAEEGKEKGKEAFESSKEFFLETKETITESISKEDSLKGQQDFAKIQKKVKKPKKNKRLAKADSAFAGHLYHTAITKYQKAFSKTKNSQDRNRIQFHIAESYRLSGQVKQAISQYKRVLRLKNYEFDPKVYLYLADLQRLMGIFDEAAASYNSYIELVGEDPLAIQKRDNCLQTENKMKVETRYEVSSLRKLNSKDNDWAPRLFDESGEILTFTSTREGVAGKKLDEWSGERFSDIFVSTIDSKGSWSKPELLDANFYLCSPASESDASFTKGGSRIYYTLCNNRKKTINRCVIYTATFDGNAWSEPSEVLIGTDSVFDYIHPYITPDGKKLYFTSNRPGGHGDLDIWMSEGSETNFGIPVNLGSQINTVGKEAYPFYFNENTIYFSSNGHPGLGGYDIYKASRQEDSTWSVESLPFPINSYADDFGIVYLPSGNKGFFSTSRNTKWGDDIYSFYLPDILFSISGIVRNDQNMQPINDAQVFLLGSDGTLVRALTNSRGLYKFDAENMKENTTYQVRVEKKNFLEMEAVETTVGLKASKEFVRDFSLKPMPKGPVVLPNILYDLGKWDLKAQYEDSLMGLIELLEKNPRLVIELASHTDARPIPMTNDSLSQYRAQSVVNYLVARGIHPERLMAKGYGSRAPRILQAPTNIKHGEKEFVLDSGNILSENFIASLKDKNEQEGAHQLNRRTEFSILRDDFIPSGQGSVLNGIAIGDKDEEKKISYRLNPKKIAEIDLVVNGVQFTALIDEKAKENSISCESALQLLQIGKLTKTDFEKTEKAFNEDGEVKENEKLTIREIKIGPYYLDKVSMRSKTEIGADIILTTAALRTIAPFDWNKNTQQIIFK